MDRYHGNRRSRNSPPPRNHSNFNLNRSGNKIVKEILKL